MKVRCNKCNGVFNEEDLPIEHDAVDGDLTHVCPNCHMDGWLMDLEDNFNDALVCFTIQDVIDTVYCNTPNPTPSDVMTAMNEMLEAQVACAKWVLKDNMDRIMKELKDNA